MVREVQTPPILADICMYQWYIQLGIMGSTTLAQRSEQ